MDLDRFYRGSYIGHISPEYGMRLGVINRYAIDRDIDTVRVCTPDTKTGVTDTRSGIRGHDNRRGLGDKEWDTLPVVPAA